MSNFAYTITPMTELDIPEFAANLAESKLPLTINRLLYKNWPDNDAQLAIYTRTVEMNLKDTASEQRKVTDDETGRMIGHIVLTRRKPVARKARVEDSEVKDETLECFNKGVYEAVVRAAVKVEILKDIEHLEITHLYLKPGYRQLGVGSKLVHLAIESAHSLGLALTVCSEPEPHEFFTRFGFEDVEFVDIDLRLWAVEYTGFGIFRLFGMIHKQ